MTRYHSVDDTAVSEELPCAFCRGKGVDPFAIMSSRSICCVCGGSGKVQVRAPRIPCAHCRGTGATKTLTCTTCGGKGSVSRPALPLISCPACYGTGDDASASAMACLRCHGRGCVTAAVKGKAGAGLATDTDGNHPPPRPQTAGGGAGPGEPGNAQQGERCS